MGYNIKNEGILITSFRKNKKKITICTWEKGKWRLKRCQKITRVEEQEPIVQPAGRARSLQVEEMYLSKPGNWQSVSEQYWCHAKDNPSEENIYIWK